MDFFVLLSTMVKLFSLILVGYFLRRANRLGDEMMKQTSFLVANIMMPALILYSSSTPSSISDAEIIQCLLLGIVLYVVFIVMSKWIAHKIAHTHEDKALYQILLAFANFSFIGYPLLEVMYGNYAVFVFTVLHLPFNILIYTYGVYLLNKGKRSFKVKEYVRMFLTPGVITSIIALVCFLAKFKLPSFVTETSGLLGQATVPLSMIVVGGNLSFAGLAKNKETIALLKNVFIKMFIFPFIGFGLIYFLDVSVFLKELFVFSFMLPSASIPLMLALQYDVDTSIASKTISLTTLVSVVSIPLFIFLLF